MKIKKKVYFSFLNQGVSCLLENHIITKKDKNFIFGYLILLVYLCKEKQLYEMENITHIIKKMRAYKFNEIEQIKAVVSYVIFCLNHNNRFNLRFTEDLKKDDPYLNGFNFYESIIKELKEESELMLMLLQLNSGFGFELLNNNYSYKISMISIEDIKSHLLMNIPKYFFTFQGENSNWVLSDQRTQIIAFNEEVLFEYKSQYFTQESKTMNIVIGIFHESGHQKFHMNINVGAKLPPILYIKKNYELGIQEDSMVKLKERGEAGKCIDNYLYGYGFNPGFLIKSNNSSRLMKKTLFLGKLDKLNELAEQIAIEFSDEIPNNKSLNTNLNQINYMENTFQMQEKRIFDFEFIIIDGKEFPCGLNVDCD